MVLVFVDTKLFCKPVGLANCGNTCFQNAFIQMIYQVDPLIDILLKHQNLYVVNTLGYTFQHLVWDIAAAQKDNKSIGCGSTSSPTNLGKFTGGMSVCMGLGVGSQGDLPTGFVSLMQELKKAASLDSILSMNKESIIYVPDSEPYVVPRRISVVPSIILNPLSGPQSLENQKLENYIKNEFVTKKASWLDPRTNIEHKNVDMQYKLTSAPEFIFFFYQAEPGMGFAHLRMTTFSDELNLSPYIKGNIKALYQLRAIGVHAPFWAGGHYIAVVRDSRDNKLYQCNDTIIKEVPSWKNGIETFNPAAFLYVLKKDIKQKDVPTKDVKTVSDSTVLVDKLNKLQQGLKNIEIALKNHQFS